MKNVKIANINIEIKELFNKWVQITHSFHNLAPRQQSVLALFLYYHYKFKEDITNEKLLWKAVFDYDTKALIKEELGIHDQSLQNSLTALRKKKVIINNTIAKNFIPEIEGKSNNFKVIYNFNIIHE